MTPAASTTAALVAAVAASMALTSAPFTRAAARRRTSPPQATRSTMADRGTALVQRWCDRAGRPDLSRWAPAWATAAAATTGAAPWLPGGLVLAPAIVLGPPLSLWFRRDHAAIEQARHVPDLLDAVASGLRSGTALGPAIVAAGARVAPWRTPIDDLERRLDAGQPLREALADWDDDPRASVRLCAAALSTAATVGGPGAAALAATAQSVRQRADADAAVDGLAAQATLSARLLTVAPIGFAVVVTSLDPRAGQLLLGTSAGRLCVVAGVGLDLLGARWMARLVTRARG